MELNPRRVEQQLRNFQRALDAYRPIEPFARFLVRFFRENKQMGSSDRRMVSRLCYNLFRLGQSLRELSISDRLVVAEFLCEEESALVELYQPSWAAHITKSSEDKLTFIEKQGYQVREHLFPFTSTLSAGIVKEPFAISHLTQPDLFIRVPSRNQRQLERELQAHGITFEREAGNAYRLPNGSKLQHISKIDGLYEVQDLSSQQCLTDLPLDVGTKWWDACAGAGGKSLLLLDRCPGIDLLVSDIRPTILRNLDERVAKARVKTTYRKKVLDLTQLTAEAMAGETFDGIVIDAPCSGSGTWGRTPEMLCQFEERNLDHFTQLQRQILDNVLPYLKSGGVLVYITCSVFEVENEGLIQYAREKYGLLGEGVGSIPGYRRKADSMFAARLYKP